VHRFILSTTCAVYGIAERLPLLESPTRQIPSRDDTRTRDYI